MDINTLLISPDYIKKFSVVGDNTMDAYITPAILDSQLIGLQPIIGTMLYDKVCQLVADDTISLEINEKYKELLDNYISQYLLNKVQSELCINLFAKMRNAGMVYYADNNEQQMTIKDINFIRAEFDSKASFYAKRMTDYLCSNSKDFKEWHNRRDCSDMPSDKKDAYSGNLNLHKYRNTKQRYDL